MITFKTEHYAFKLLLTLVLLGMPLFSFGLTSSLAEAAVAKKKNQTTARKMLQAPPLSLFGVVMGTPEEARYVGAKWVHQYITWDTVETERGHYDFSGADSLVAPYLKAGLNVIVKISGSTKWDPCPFSAKTPGDCSISPANDRFRSFVSALVRHFKGRVFYWELGQEPSDSQGFSGEPVARFLQVGYEAIKKEDPSSQVIFTPMATTAFPAVKKVLSALRGSRGFDLIGAHPIREWTGPLQRYDESNWGTETQMTFKEEMIALRRLFTEAGYGTPDMVITEMCWAGDDEHVGQETSGCGKTLTEEQQAQYLREMYNLVQNDPGLRFIKTICWWEARAEANEATSSSNDPDSGLFRPNGQPKPAAEAYRSLKK